MNEQTPHYMLLSETSRTEGLGRWRFELQPLDGSPSVEVADAEPDVWGERLELLTIVRALESLDQRSKVTLVGCCRYIEQGIQFGLPEWKENDWRWEYFGQMVPVRDCDLWQRLDRVMQFHEVDCRRRRFDPGHAVLNGPHWNMAGCGKHQVIGQAAGNWVKCHARGFELLIRRRMRALVCWMKTSLAIARRLRIGRRTPSAWRYVG